MQNKNKRLINDKTASCIYKSDAVLLMLHQKLLTITFLKTIMSNTRIHYLQHVPYEGLGAIHTWISENSYTLTQTRFFKNESLPDPDDFDLLIVMGGPMSVNDEQDYDWLIKEKAFIRKSIEKNKSVLGICLGAQLIASAMGAKVYPHPEKEIGWFPLENARGADHDTPFFLTDKQLTVFHWHGETFDLPKGSLHLYRSHACENQGFLLKTNVLGLQFHFEATIESVAAMAHHGHEEIAEGGKYVQSSAKITAPNNFYQPSHQKLYPILDYLIKQSTN